MQQAQVLSYLAMRRCIGFLGAGLPILLFVDSCMTGYERDSISAFYYYPEPYINGAFIGIMCAIGVFLICYRGHGRNEPGGEKDWFDDNTITHVAGFAALGVAIFPTVDPAIEKDLCHILECDEKVYRVLHYLSAFILFGCLSRMSFRFSRNNANLKRNKLYRGCGVLIVVMIIVVALFGFVWDLKIFWPEVIIVWAFATSWIVKGFHLQGDREGQNQTGRGEAGEATAGDA